MEKKENNYAFIDSQNVNLSIRRLGWYLDWRRFRIYLQEKYAVSKAYLFIGYVEGNNDLYISLQQAGFICIFKPTLKYKDGTIKGNVDADLVLQAMIEYPNYDKAVIVTGDGDFLCLADYLLKQEKLETVLIPNSKSYSALLKRINRPDRKYIAFMDALQERLEYKMKRAS
jgi:uncharacterized LabA/DUF88 family protein